MTTIKRTSNNKCFGGWVQRFTHQSTSLNCEMTFSVFLPPMIEESKVPVLYWLSGLTCNDQNFITKSGAQKAAAQYNIALIVPDTSPRGTNIEGQDKEWDFGIGAGFYVNATEPKWKEHFNMYDYITKELPQLVNSNFNVDSTKTGIFGHSMGGHGALICALKNPGLYRSVSAFAPISNPINCPWGVKAFSGYLGIENRETSWLQYDATELVKNYKGPELQVLIDQGTEDNFYKEKQLLPENFVSSSQGTSVSTRLRLQEGYDHSYYFISSFIDEHISHHASFLH